MQLEQLLIQPIKRIDLIQPWRSAGKKVGVVADSLLAGAMAIHFADSALVFRSPLRFASCQTGTVVGMRSSGASLTLGYRFDVMPSEDVDGFFCALEPRLSLFPEQWPGLVRVGLAQSIFLLAELAQIGGTCCLRLRLLDRGWCSVTYRRDLDGAIEFSPQHDRVEVSGFVVNAPTDEFGWLHTASAHPFVLDGQYWRTAHPRDWPWPLCKALRSHACPPALHAATLQRALLAKFSQHPALRRRLLAMTATVEVDGIPAGVLGAVRAACSLAEPGDPN